ncbi:hypothetical protein FIV07_10315 [Mycobacterium sp. THAF192]|nr:hypothetical protein FIV07_10315 [Mycobacterium sp. THAF192]
MSRRKRPAGNRPSPNTTNGYTDSSLHRPEDGYTAPTAAERREAELLAEIKKLGYTVAVRCTACNHPLVAGASVARHLGPKCAAKAADHG